jgi:hypothetical protein
VCCTFIAKDNFISPTIHRLIAWGLVLMALGVEPHAFAIDDSGHETFRLVRMRVLNADGSSAVHRDVYLQGWDRRAIGPLLGQAFDSFITSNDRLEARKSGWLYTTDDQGKVTVRIGNFAGWKDQADRPGWGTYGLLIDPGPNDSGAVSQRFWSGPSNEAPPNMDWPPEWGQPLPLPSEGLSLAMCLHPGFTLYGRLVDNRDHRTPLPNVSVVTWNDLEIDTHTGFGGQVFTHSAITDTNGEFQIPHEFRNKLYVRLSGVWMTTLHNEWIPQEQDVIEPSGDNGMRIEFGVLVNQKFHYTGRVTDVAGKPVVDADVVVGISSQPNADSYGDSHHFERTKTDADGKYDLAATSPWGTFLEAEDKIHGRVDLKWPGYDSPPIPPGLYDLSFLAKSTK